MKRPEVFADVEGEAVPSAFLRAILRHPESRKRAKGNAWAELKWRRERRKKR